MTPTNGDRVLEALNELSEVSPKQGEQTLALVEALSAVGRLAKMLGETHAQGYAAALMLNLTKPRREK
jgi:hypothetical protein